MSILNYFKKMLGFSTEKKSTDDTQVVPETTCPVETIYEISPQPIKLVKEQVSDNSQITDSVTKKPSKKTEKAKVSGPATEQKTKSKKEATKPTVGEIKSGAKKSDKK